MTNTTHTWTVKNVKTFTGMEGTGYSCALYCDTAKAAIATDDATGGSTRFEWVSPAHREVFNAYCASLPKWGAKYGKEDIYDVTPDIALDALISTYLEEKRLRSHCKTKILFKAPGDGVKDGEWRTIKGTFTTKNVAEMRKRYGAEVEILNYKFGPPSV